MLSKSQDIMSSIFQLWIIRQIPLSIKFMKPIVSTTTKNINYSFERNPVRFWYSNFWIIL